MGPVINIIISGEAGVGKTTICECIKNALNREGLTHWSIDGEGDPPSFLRLTYSERIKSMKNNNIDIHIKTILLEEQEEESHHEKTRQKHTG